MSPAIVESYDRAILQFDMLIDNTRKNKNRLQSIMYRLTEQSVTQRIRDIQPKSKECK